MPLNRKTIKSIKELVFPLTKATTEIFKGLTLAAVDSSNSQFDLNDFAGMLLLVENPDDITTVSKILSHFLSPLEFHSLVTTLIIHDGENFYTDPHSFQRSNSLLTKLFKMEFIYYEDISFDILADDHFVPIIDLLISYLENDLLYNWNKDFNKVMADKLHQFLSFVFSADYLSAVNPVFKQNCSSLFFQLNLYSPYIFEEEKLQEKTSSRMTIPCALSEEQEILNSTLLVKVGGYFFLRYLCPKITEFTSHRIFKTVTNSANFSQIITKLQSADEDSFRKVLTKMQKYNHVHLRKIERMTSLERAAPGNLIYLKTLAQFLFTHHFTEILVYGFSTPLMKIISCTDPGMRKNPAPWVSKNEAWKESWNEILQTNFKNKAEYAELGRDWIEEGKQFLRKISEKMGNFILPGDVPLSGAKFELNDFKKHRSHFDSTITNLLKQQDIYHHWLPNDPFLFAVRNKQLDKIVWFLNRVPDINLLRSIEVAYRPKANYKQQIRLVAGNQEKSISFEDCSLKGDSSNNQVFLANKMNRLTPLHGTAYLLSIVVLLDKLELLVRDNTFLNNKEQTVTIESYLPQEIFPENTLMFIKSILTSPEPRLEHSPKKWLIYQHAETIASAVDLMSVFEKTADKIWKEDNTPLIIQPITEIVPDLRICSVRDQKICEIKVVEIVRALIKVFLEQEEEESHITNEFLEIIFSSFNEVIQERAKMAKNTLDLKSTLPVYQENHLVIEFLGKQEKQSTLDSLDIFSKIVELFTDENFAQLEQLRTKMSPQDISFLKNQAASLFGIKKSHFTFLNTVDSADILKILLLHLIRTPVPHPQFNQDYIVQGSFNSAFTRILFCCYFLKQSVFSVSEQESKNYFKEACYFDVQFIIEIISNLNNAAKFDFMNDNIDLCSIKLYPFFIEAVTPLPPPIPLRKGIKLNEKKKPPASVKLAQDNQAEEGKEKKKDILTMMWRILPNGLTRKEEKEKEEVKEKSKTL